MWFALFSSGLFDQPRYNEEVFIQPYNYQQDYMKNDEGNIAFAALQNQPECKS